MLNLRSMVTGSVAVLLLSPAAFVLTTPERAAADNPPGDCGSSCADDGGSDGDAENGFVSVRVWGSTSTAGEEGFDIPPSEVWVQPICYFTQYENGKDAWDKRHWNRGPQGEEEDIDWEKYKDEEEGYWWLRTCSTEHWEDERGDWLEYSREWFENNPPVYVFPGDPIPVPEVPPEVLVEVAYDAMELPEPEVSWNPQRQGDGATLVNVDTWFWLDDGVVDLEVHAEAGDNIATVEASLAEMGFSAPTAEPVTCEGFGVEWSPDAASGCSLAFERSSAAMPGLVTPVLAESHWNIEWYANDEPQGELDPQTTEQEFAVPVAEAQARAVW